MAFSISRDSVWGWTSLPAAFTHWSQFWPLETYPDSHSNVSFPTTARCSKKQGWAVVWAKVATDWTAVGIYCRDVPQRLVDDPWGSSVQGSCARSEMISSHVNQTSFLWDLETMSCVRGEFPEYTEGSRKAKRGIMRERRQPWGCLILIMPDFPDPDWEVPAPQGALSLSALYRSKHAIHTD